MKCHCGTELTDHETFAPKSGGALHCFGCGCCFLLDGTTPRPGVPQCAQVQAPPEMAPEEPEPAESAEAEAEEMAIEEPEKPARSRK